jgi:hypothetical protein
MTDTAPFTRTIEATIPAATIAADVDQAITEAPFDATVTKVALVPEAAATGDNTNFRTFTLVNKGQAGAGTTVVATLALTTGVNLVAFDEKLFTLSVVAGATSVVAGDVLQVNEVHTASGLAHSGGRVIIEFTRA